MRIVHQRLIKKLTFAYLAMTIARLVPRTTAALAHHAMVASPTSHSSTVILVLNSAYSANMVTAIKLSAPLAKIHVRHALTIPTNA